MATTQDEEGSPMALPDVMKEDDILGPSLLDVMQNMSLSSLKATFYSRSCFVGTYSSTDVDGPKKIQDFFVKTLQSLSCDASGLVFMLDGALVVLIESTADHFTDICVALHDFPNVSDVKVVATCDDNSKRLIPSLFFKKLSISKPNDANESDVPQAASTMFFNLVTLARRLGTQPAANIKKSLAAPSNSDQVLFPSAELVQLVAKSPELMTLDEYLTIYRDPITVELESERVWPIHPLISY
ncbi:hypothetical protein SDRG_01934 [Saprolegnia diclina VS20]|uniref:BLUF domain-containing protein n=1 Tax=Saprolegnia diclina (strain VS20) TaxID=1156394 RepID=T0S6R4_SAPDV|nr:hypothetical protein SDRG_01934 [Saprolegnia diclina VS20]EQC40868.1 hypothetical protein SDRG_01934 [Saprolegnia diclina VS20]|eukprot:XP_008605712.1 hypothetical protein SDRG_01934 [Saprolegnia diclina VS20]